jgi:hypothetical protein
MTRRVRVGLLNFGPDCRYGVGVVKDRWGTACTVIGGEGKMQHPTCAGIASDAALNRLSWTWGGEARRRTFGEWTPNADSVPGTGVAMTPGFEVAVVAPGAPMLAPGGAGKGGSR